MTAKLSSISTLANKLNNSTAQINAKIREVSDGLTEMNIGLEVWLLESYLGLPNCDIHYDEKASQAAAGSNPVPIDKTGIHVDGDGLCSLRTPNLHLVHSFDATQLGFAKVEDKWQIATRTVTREEFEGDAKNGRMEVAFRVSNPRNQTPLLKAPRNLRLAALPLLDQLTDEIAEMLRNKLALLDDTDKETNTVAVSVFAVSEQHKKLLYCGACDVKGATPDNPLLTIGPEFERAGGVVVHEKCLLELIEKAKLTSTLGKLHG